jgi:hypothetical protein
VAWCTSGSDILLRSQVLSTGPRRGVSTGNAWAGYCTPAILGCRPSRVTARSPGRLRSRGTIQRMCARTDVCSNDAPLIRTWPGSAIAHARRALRLEKIQLDAEKTWSRNHSP